jgi:anti-sigma regulatory factor (Ser/Thr protein kinase)
VDYFVDPSNLRAPGELRREIAGYLHRHAEMPDEVWQAELIVEEMVGNALRHAGGPVWVSLHWAGPEPVLTVHDLDAAFDLDPTLPDDPLAESGRGLFLVAHLASELSMSAKRAGGKALSVRLPVRRRAEQSINPMPGSHEPLPTPEEAGTDGAFGRDPFLRALVVELAAAVERLQGPGVAETVVASVGLAVGGADRYLLRAAQGCDRR